MQKNLIIVESPAKAKTIEKYLGSDYKVLSSYGHICDLKDIELENNYKPVYVIPSEKEAVVKNLKKEAKNVSLVWLASDEDREGEAIAWHLYEVLGLNKECTKRIVFHEITKDAILHAIDNPRGIDYNLVDAQQARRVLDRIVGFELSPILWKKIRPSLSAGRVQSVAVRLIVEREREINAFQAEVSYRVIAEFKLADGTILKAELARRLPTEKEAYDLLEKFKNAVFEVEDIVTKPVKKSPAPPFTTSTLQQEASRKMGYSVAQTMSIAQKLYESGYITYMRTDSVNLSDLALNASKKEITSEFGEKYVNIRRFQTKTKGAQEAHEAIRPTYMNEKTIKGSAQEQRLYELIRKRTIASQMADADLERTIVSISISNCSSEKLLVTGEVIKFDGFLRVYLEGNDDEFSDENETAVIPPLKLHEKLDLEQTIAQERLSQRPPRYTEASLVRKLEDLGIGRPSTYAPTISTIQNRDYVIKGNKDGTERNFTTLTLNKGKITSKIKKETVGADKNKLMPTDTGSVVNDFLTEYFPSVLDYSFTAGVEKELDKIADGDQKWTKTIDDFYKHFHPIVEQASAIKTEYKIGERVLGADPETGKTVSVKIGRYGPFVQIGHADDEKKPQFAPLMKGQSIETISLEEALKLFELPRLVGEIEGKQVTAAIGRFGPFVKYNNMFVSIPKTMSPLTITIEEAKDLIRDKQEKEANRIIQTFPQDEKMQVLNGRFGPYIAYDKANYKIPKGKVAAELSYDECLKIINDSPDKAKDKKDNTKKNNTEKTTKTTAKKSTVKKKSTAKEKTGK